MAYYKVCSKCGCNLDPGEKCDCEREKKKQEEFYQRVTRITPRTGRLSLVLDSKEVQYARNAAY